jgi:hypothetical protein
MTSKISVFINRIHPAIWQILCLIVSVVVFSLILANRSPNILRSVSMALRTGFGVVIPLAALVLYLALHIRGRFGELISLSAVMSVFAFGLAGVWASGNTQSILLSGLVPLSDATNYYIDALRILHGIEISDFSAMRPFFAGFLSFTLWLTDRNLLNALSVITAIAGVTSYLSAREIQRTHGTEAGVFFLILMFLYYRHHSGTTMSETLGVSVSLLGFALIWQSISTKNAKLSLLGIALITLSLNVRPGAMFVLPALLIWGGVFFRQEKRFSISFILFGAVLIASVFALNKLMIYILAGPGKTAFSNFSWALYGLVSGGQSWSYIFQTHPEVLSQDSNTAVYKLVFEQLIQNPLLTLQGAFKYWRMFFSNTWYNAYSFVAGENYQVNEAARWSMYFLGLLGIMKWTKKRDDPYVNLAILGGLGVLASVPFVPPTDAYRVRLYAATIPFFGLIPAMGIAFLREKLPDRFFRNHEQIASNLIPSILISILLVISMLAAPSALRSTGKSPFLKHIACMEGLDGVAIRFDEGTFINIHRENSTFIDWMPNFHASIFRSNAHALADLNLTNKLKELNPPFTVFYSLDFLSNQQALINIQTSLLPEPRNFLYLCGSWDNDPEIAAYRLFHADSIAETP